MHDPERRATARLPSGLRALGELHRYEVADGDPDIRGWMVTAADGVTVGSVADLLVDVDTLSVRYLVVDLGPTGAYGTAERLVVVPLRPARLDPAQDQVHLPHLGSSELSKLPEYTRASLDRDNDAALLRRIGVAAVAGADAAKPPR